jgi:UDP-N-acetylglucosamine--N-acetylmuramyl-(pentapeptide) pyrophosphoryl-undecaprenol N-acetylglucosamine transferase
VSGPLVFVCAGGTGGHLFPAEALSHALQAQGARVDLVTDERAEKYGYAFPARQTHIVPAATLTSKNPVALARTFLTLGRGFLMARKAMKAERPAVVVGFGGYPTLPPLHAAIGLGISTVIHDQNAVMGRANRQLAPKVSAIALSFPGVLEKRPELAAKATVTGNPVRPAVVAVSDVPYDIPAPDTMLRVLVFGGSQGARVMADVVPPAMAALPAGLLARIVLTQQAREEDHARVVGRYAELGLRHEVRPFFTDLPARIANAHLVIGRAGASTVAELAAIGRPSILVPLPGALDQDQLANAKTLAKAGGTMVITQDQFTPNRLAQELTTLAGEPGRLATLALGAKRLGATDAAQRLAALVLSVAGGPRPGA